MYFTLSCAIMLRRVRMIMVSTLSTCGCFPALPSLAPCWSSLLRLSSFLFFKSLFIYLFIIFLFFETIEISVFQCHKHTMLSGTQKETLALLRLSCAWSSPGPHLKGTSSLLLWELQLEAAGLKDDCALSCFNSHYFLADYVLFSSMLQF